MDKKPSPIFLHNNPSDGTVTSHTPPLLLLHNTHFYNNVLYTPSFCSACDFFCMAVVVYVLPLKVINHHNPNQPSPFKILAVAPVLQKKFPPANYRVCVTFSTQLAYIFIAHLRLGPLMHQSWSLSVPSFKTDYCRCLMRVHLVKKKF